MCIIKSEKWLPSSGTSIQQYWQLQVLSHTSNCLFSTAQLSCNNGITVILTMMYWFLKKTTCNTLKLLENCLYTWRTVILTEQREKLNHLPVNSLVMALFCRRAEQMSSSQGGRNSWWLARSSAMVLGEPGEDLCSPSPSWLPSSMESTSRKSACWGGFTLKRGRSTHLMKKDETWKEKEKKTVTMFSSFWFCLIDDINHLLSGVATADSGL